MKPVEIPQEKRFESAPPSLSTEPCSRIRHRAQTANPLTGRAASYIVW